MAYELFKRTTARQSSEPALAISRTGRFQFNAGCTRLLQSKDVQSVHLLWDKDHRKIAVRDATSSKVDGAYELHYTQNGRKGCGFAAKTFLSWIGYQEDSTKVYACKWDERKLMLEVALGSSTPARARAKSASTS